VSNPMGGTHTAGPSAMNGTSKASKVAGRSREAVTQAAVDVKGTAREQAQRVSAEAQTQARTIAADVRDKLSEQARTQNDKLVSTIRQTADHLDEMRGDRQDSPAAAVVSRVADSGRQLADYLDRNGAEGVLREVEDFARRRPGAFLATALAAGFVVGRLGKSIAKADPHAGAPAAESGTGAFAAPPPQPTQDPAAAMNRTGADQTGTAYAATGAGTPSVLDEFTRMQHRASRS
jgi:hypothetical protein